jgi:hypothetical protein
MPEGAWGIWKTAGNAVPGRSANTVEETGRSLLHALITRWLQPQQAEIALHLEEHIVGASRSIANATKASPA